MLAAHLVSVYGAETKPRNAISKTAAVKNLLAGRVAEVRLLQKLYSPRGDRRADGLGVLWGKKGLPKITAASFSVLRAVSGRNGYDDSMGKTILICLLSFVVGAAATAAPFLIAGHFAHLDEAARGEETMGPGITTFLGLLASPVGGIIAVVIALWLSKRKKATTEPPE